jgi:hypothetical protein
MSIAFGSGPSNGQFWFGGSSFPGFLYKKNLGVGGRRSTKMNPGGNITCNSATYLYNKYTPGGSGVGASSMSNRRAKNRLATVCRSGSDTKNCFPCQPSLGQYSNYTHNPNGYYSCNTQSETVEKTYSVTGVYKFLAPEPGFNTIIEFTGPSVFTAYKSFVNTSLLYVNGVLVKTMIVNVVPGSYNIPAGFNPPTSSDFYKIITKFNV